MTSNTQHPFRQKGDTVYLLCWGAVISATLDFGSTDDPKGSVLLRTPNGTLTSALLTEVYSTRAEAVTSAIAYAKNKLQILLDRIKEDKEELLTWTTFVTSLEKEATNGPL